MCVSKNVCCFLAVLAAVACCAVVADAGTVTVSMFTGGDTGEGLDLDGSYFPYALDIGGPGGEHVRDVSFAEPVGPGMTVEVTALENLWGVVGHWVKPEFGDTVNDNALEYCIGYAGYATGTTAVSIHLGQDGGPKLVEGLSYRLQIMEMERIDLPKGAHYMDLSSGTKPEEPLLLADNFSDAADSLDTGSVLTYDFVATAGDANEFFIELYSASKYGEIPSGDYYDDPYLSAVTLECLSDIIIYPGDANADGKVNEKDAAILAAHWLQSEGVTWYDGNFNNDDVVDGADATIMATNWQRNGLAQATAAVPEPSAAALLLVIAVLCCGLARSRSRL